MPDALAHRAVQSYFLRSYRTSYARWTDARGQPLNVILAKSMMFRMTVNRSGSLEEIGSKNKAVTDVDFWECVKKECRQRDRTSSSSIDGHINVSGDC